MSGAGPGIQPVRLGVCDFVTSKPCVKSAKDLKPFTCVLVEAADGVVTSQYSVPTVPSVRAFLPLIIDEI